MEISYSPGFLRSLHSFSSSLQTEVIEKVELLKNFDNHSMLKVHKLSGVFKGCYSCSVNDHVRIILQFVGKPKQAYLLAVDNHDGAYKKS